MSQKMEHQPIPLREKAHEIFATAKSVAGKAEAEIILVSRIDEYLRFGNNELAQSQYSTSRNLSVRIASGTPWRSMAKANASHTGRAVARATT